MTARVFCLCLAPFVVWCRLVSFWWEQGPRTESRLASLGGSGRSLSPVARPCGSQIAPVTFDEVDDVIGLDFPCHGFRIVSQDGLPGRSRVPGRVGGRCASLVNFLAGNGPRFLGGTWMPCVSYHSRHLHVFFTDFSGPNLPPQRPSERSPCRSPGGSPVALGGSRTLQNVARGPLVVSDPVSVAVAGPEAEIAQFLAGK